MRKFKKIGLPTSKNRFLPDIKYVQIQTHSRCNADCIACPYVESWHADNHGTMAQDLWIRILDNLVPFKGSLEKGKICPYLMQEPLIDKTIFDKINDIYSYFPRTCVEVSTNGAALTDKTIDNLFTCMQGKRHDIWVSHHGIDEETLNYIMKIDYKKATDNLINLLRKSNGRFNIKIRGAGSIRTCDKVFFTRKQYLDYLENLFIENNINRKNVNIDYFSFHDRAGTLHRTDRDANTFNIGKVREIGPGHKPFYCPRLDQWLHFMYDGQIRLCCMDYHAEVKLPNIKDVWLPDYFMSDTYIDLVEKVAGIKESEDNFICKRCISPGG